MCWMQPKTKKKEINFLAFFLSDNVELCHASYQTIKEDSETQLKK